MAILPVELFEQTYLKGPYLGRSVHEVSGPAEMKSIMQDNFMDWHKSPLIMRMLRPILGDAILTAHGDHWREQRKILQPAFFKKRVTPFIPIMKQAADAIADGILKRAQPVEIHEVMNDATFSIIEQVLFSDTEDFKRGEVREAIDVLLEEIGIMRMSDLIPVPDWIPRYMTRRARRARTVFRDAAMREILKRRQRDDPGTDILGLLLKVEDPETGQRLSNTDIRDTLMTFIAAGHETTAIALTWSLYLLSHDHTAQDQVRAEAWALKDMDRMNDDLGLELTFTRQVIEEALRLYPPAPILGRRAIRDTEICGHPVQKGDVVLLAFYALHRHKDFWAFPNHFDPDRWSQDRRPKDRYQFMAFGGGPRACLGSQFAMMEASIILSTLIRRLEVHPVKGVEITPVMQVTLRPRDGLPLQFRAVQAKSPRRKRA